MHGILEDSSDLLRGEGLCRGKLRAVEFLRECLLLLKAEILHHLGCNLANNGINYQPQLVNAGFQPSTVG